MTFGDVAVLQSSTNGDGDPSYTLISGPGLLTGSTLTATAVGSIQVRVDYPATAGFTAGSATATITVNPKPVSFTLVDQDFDYDGSAKTAAFSISDPAAVSAGMVDTSGLTRGPGVNSYSVSVSANGNYTGSASATMRIWPKIQSFAFAPPPNPQVTSFTVTPVAQWPSPGSVQWSSADADTVSVKDDAGTVVSSLSAGNFVMPVFDVRGAPYNYSVTATPKAGLASMAQAGGASARLQGPGLDADVTGLSSYPISTSGTYTYTVSANGLSRSASFDAVVPNPAVATAGVNVLPATVTGTWSTPVSIDGPHTVTADDLPTWKIQTGQAVSAATTLTWTRLDDGITGAVSVGGLIQPGTYQLTASVVPPSGNYSSASVMANWALTVPITVLSSHASVSINGIERPSGTVVRTLPGTSALFSAAPQADYAWGTDWNTPSPTIWSGSTQIIPDDTKPSYSSVLPAGISSLTLSASAFQVPPVISVTPVASSFTVPSGPAAGHTYPRTWQDGGSWKAYLARDGVLLSVVGASRESSVASYEVQAKSPEGDWTTLVTGAPPVAAPNGPRVKVSQTFSIRLGEPNPEKPLMPANLSLAGTWKLRARVESTSGTWSDWSDEQPLLVVVPLQTVSMQGRTLPPINDAAWFTPSAMRSYSLQVWVP